ncbi:hypothetical protein ALC57_12903 [Trachymyrmex cornetzi]|uniref:Uncharacterized protein n=1 Tax=Trachymyrmex cornetzi TaxID=471704 RepID=A0A151J099_9HYME|nr:hypothetical protein ALC57_12903 [Trachymyrmex cornetzi]
MSGFGRHTSKVIAYLRDQVGPPAFREVIKTIVLAEPPPLITANYPWGPPSLLHASLSVAISGRREKAPFTWSPRPRLANSAKL